MPEAYRIETATLGRRPWFSDLACGRLLAQTIWRQEQHAETLAFERYHELEELQKSWIWKYRIFMMRRKARRAPHPPA